MPIRFSSASVDGSWYPIRGVDAYQQVVSRKTQRGSHGNIFRSALLAEDKDLKWPATTPGTLIFLTKAPVRLRLAATPDMRT